MDTNSRSRPVIAACAGRPAQKNNAGMFFTKIHMHFTVTGKDIPAAAVERAIELSHEKYYSASIMLGKTAEITTSFDLIEAA